MVALPHAALNPGGRRPMEAWGDGPFVPPLHPHSVELPMPPFARRLLPLTACALLLLPARSHAAPTPYLGVHGGTSLGLAPWDLGGYTPAGEPLVDDGAWSLGGVRVGLQVVPRLGVELGGSLTPVSSTGGGDNLVGTYDLDVAWHFLEGTWSPYASVGVGGYHVWSGDIGGDFDPHGQIGVGARGFVLPWMALRAEARDVISDGFGPAGAHHLELRAGVDVFLKPVRKLDVDLDGLSDADDACVDVAGPASTGGCPDVDADGLADRVDECPATAGLPELRGCSDADADGLVDEDDACPSVGGLPALHGCPDGDRDGDSVADLQDACPDLRGLVDAGGCLPTEVRAFTGTIDGIHFESGRAAILPDSHATLDRASRVLADFPELRLRVTGHTDDQGPDDANLALSEARATAVVAYLAGQGVDPARLVAKGYGESMPIADNATSAGRAANRRIAFTLVTPEVTGEGVVEAERAP